MTIQQDINPRTILEEFDTLVIEAMIAGLTKEAAEEKVTLYQKEKYGIRSNDMSSGITQ